jgi:hypothetical protein
LQISRRHFEFDAGAKLSVTDGCHGLRGDARNVGHQTYTMSAGYSAAFATLSKGRFAIQTRLRPVCFAS